MSMTDRPRRATQWAPDPVFQESRDRSSFLRSTWDVPPARSFGHWAIQTESETATHDHRSPQALASSSAGETGAVQALVGAVTELAAASGPVSLEGTPSGETPSARAASARTPSEQADSIAPPAPLQEPVASSQHRVDPQWAAELQASAHNQGYADGQAAAHQAHEESMSRELALIRAARQAIEALRSDPDQLHAPLQRLALRLAQALVRGELSVSPDAIERLVEMAIDSLDTQAPSVVVDLHPDDLAQMQAILADRDLPWRLEVDPALSRGSVRARAGDALAEDLFEDRLQAISMQLFQPSTAP